MLVKLLGRSPCRNVRALLFIINNTQHNQQRYYTALKETTYILGYFSVLIQHCNEVNKQNNQY
jgi:hypothetical protein